MNDRTCRPPLRTPTDSRRHPTGQTVASAQPSTVPSPPILLHRTVGASWVRTPRALTVLERQALAWDARCARSREVAAAITQDLGDHPDVLAVGADGDRVRVRLRIGRMSQWDGWRNYFGITLSGEQARPHLLAGQGLRDGVRVSVLAEAPLAPTTGPPPSPVPSALRAFRLDGVLYDLELPQRDAHGDVWYYEGLRTADGMPMMTLDGRLERCSLANIVAYVGPLRPVADSALRTLRP
ncbi:BN159_2729 family protein [Streptomyces sp. NPDC001260]|uniref:BN159_2729 family protein n=1 Tax=Streptomyces sp. NPDC001260 TaxID=3364551 RepID=UPI0036CD61AD